MSTCLAAAETLQFEDVTIERFPVGRHQANAYLVYSRGEGRSVLVDPGADGDTLVKRGEALGLVLDAILLTHGHWDHVGAVHVIAAAKPVPVYLHPREKTLVKAAPIYAFRIDGARITVPSSFVDLEDGATVPLGSSRALSVRHIPGHTEGGVAYRLGRALFTGDTLMPSATGRFDLPGGDPEQLEKSLAALRRDLADGDVICPGHGMLWPSSAAAAWLSSRLETRR
jgi:hydroxyacylglutathione hydrolase